MQMPKGLRDKHIVEANFIRPSSSDARTRFATIDTLNYVLANASKRR